MKLVSALVGLAALGGVALSSAAASAAPVEVPVTATGMVVPAGYVCNEWGHCWHRHDGWHHPWGYADGYGYGWHHWHQW